MFDYEKAITRPPCARFAEGLTHGLLGKPDLALAKSQHESYVKALRSYQKAVAINDKDHETYCLIAKLYAKQGNSARETASYKKAAKLGNKEAQAWMVSKGMAW